MPGILERVHLRCGSAAREAGEEVPVEHEVPQAPADERRPVGVLGQACGPSPRTSGHARSPALQRDVLHEAQRAMRLAQLSYGAR